MSKETVDVQDYLDDMADGFLDGMGTNEEFEKVQTLISQAFCFGIERKQQEIESLKAQLAQYQNTKWFSHDGENFTFHDTEEQAHTETLRAINFYRNYLADYGFDVPGDGNFNSISYGLVFGNSTYSLIDTVNEDHHKTGEYTRHEIGTKIYSLDLEKVIETAEKEV